jgi:hypothetical protein
MPRNVLVCIVILSMAALGGCGQSSSTPLGHALTAFRAGNHDDLLAAKVEAEEQIKAAIQPNQDLCYATPADITKYNTLYVIEKLDQAELLRLPEEDRLLYALKVAGESAKIQPDSFLTRSAIYRSGGGKLPPECQQARFNEALMAGGSVYQVDNEARLTVLHDWISDMKSKYGDKLDDTMRTAESHLEGAGYSSRWPVSLDE